MARGGRVKKVGIKGCGPREGGADNQAVSRRGDTKEGKGWETRGNERKGGREVGKSRDGKGGARDRGGLQ